jgi:hypothetical protein
MLIDLRIVPVLWINLEEHKENANNITAMLNGYGFENHRRTPGIRVNGFDGVSYHQKIDHYMGVGLAQLNGMRQIKSSLPALVLEDDVAISSNFNPVLEVPDDTDAVYLGVSRAGNAFGYKISDKYARIFNVLSAHAILYISDKFINDAIESSKKCLIDDQAPFDLAMSQMLARHNVLTPLNPYFYQSNQRQSENKWEHLTNCPIKIYEKTTSV